MQNSISNEIEQLRKVPIKLLLGIRDDGRKTMLRCPFGTHTDRTASFILYPDGHWHCYGCSKHGANAIDFLIEMGASFKESIEELQKYINVKT